MDFSEGEDTLALRDMVRRFIEKEVPESLAAQWDRDDHIPREMLGRIAALGLCSLTVPEEYGGLGHDVFGLIAAIQELGRRSSVLAGLFIMNAGYGSLNISAAATPEQKAWLLPKLNAGEIIFSYALSEPDVGADLAGVKTRVERRGDRIVLNGYKRWATGAKVADYMYMLVRSGDPEDRYKNLSFVIVPTDAPGLTYQEVGIMGFRGLPTNDVILDNVELPFANLVGGEDGWNNGWSLLAGPALEAEKLEVPALALGIAEAAVAEAWSYAEQRKQFGAPISALQAVRHKLAEVQTQLSACRHMINHAAWKIQNGLPSAVETSMAKLFVADTTRNIVLDCQQILGAYGYAHGFAMERYVRDILIMPIWGGASPIQKNNIANLMKLARK